MFAFLESIFKPQRSATAVTIVPKVPFALSSPEASLEFLLWKFNRNSVLDDGALGLPRLDLASAWGPFDDDYIPVSYGDLLLSAMKTLDPNATVTKIVIGGYSEGLALYYGERRLFVVGDAFVIGNEPIRGDHSECAMCAYNIVMTITGLSRQELHPIREIETRSVVLERNYGTWSIQVR